MPRKLLLHIGCHKTGTSAIQRACQSNTAFLRRHGWSFAAGPGNVANWGNAFGFARRDDGVSFWIKEDVRAHLEQSLSTPEGNVILSSEDLFFLEEDEIQKLGQMIDPLFDEIEICVYLRRQDELAVSQKSQGAKTVQSALMFGCDEGALPVLTPSVRGYLDFAQKLSLWKQAFPKARLSVREYLRKALKKGDIVSDFFSLIGCNLASDGADINASMGGNEVRLLLALRAQGLRQSEIQRIREYNWIEFTDTPFKPTREEAIAFLQEFDASNRQLPQVIGRAFAFHQDFSKYPETAPDTHYEEYERQNLYKLVVRLMEQCSLDRAMTLRDVALEIQHDRPKAALRLADMAGELHPTGRMIQNMRQRLSKIVKTD